MLAALILFACTTDIGIVTKACTTVYYPDSDGDGYGDDTNAAELCETEGYVSVGGDCDDGDATISPDGLEACDDVDNDCDGLVDDEDDTLDTSTQTRFYDDVDGDGFGDPQAESWACSAPADTVTDSADCDDADSGIHPDAAEICDDLDNDCDGAIDDEDDGLDLDTASLWYADLDADGYGDPSVEAISCAQPADSVAEAGDCDDADEGVNPDALEICDGLDNDCDGDIDDDDAGLDSGTATSWHADLDDDGFGDAEDIVVSCEAPLHYVEDAQDCDGSDAAINPDATEVCDAVDNDCDGDVDDDDASLDEGSLSTWYLDVDGDGYGADSLTWSACEAPSERFVDNESDCDDADADSYPGASELCDGEDDDCDGAVDEDPTDPSTWYADSDEDGYGDPRETSRSCEAPSGYVGNDEDCDDDDALASPALDEVCDEVDNDCDGAVDEDEAIDVRAWYADSDEDGYGDAEATRVACEEPSGYTDDDSDCDDTRRAVNPSGLELCDALDNDCDGETDETDALDAETWYADADADGYGDPELVALSCDQPRSYVSNDEDCDDGLASISPAQSEICDEVDNDCDGAVDEDSAADASRWYADADDDGYGDPDGSRSACEQPSGYISDDSDCDDSTDQTWPGAPERCDGEDNDCDGSSDEPFYEDDFSTEEDPSVLVINGDGYVDTSAGVLLMTAATTDNATTAMLAETIYADALYVSFDFTLSGGNGTAGADGVNFFIADQATAATEVIYEGGGSSLGTKGLEGWGWAVDTHSNEAYASSGDLLRAWTLDDGGTFSYGALAQMQESGEHSFELLLEDGAYSAWVDGTLEVTGTLDGWEDTLYRVGVSAATGSKYNLQVIDDLEIVCPEE